MRVYRSNRAEVLVDTLAELVEQPPHDPMTAECIVVQGRGMERWLSMELAKRLGVWANPGFAFPRTLIVRALDAALGEDEEAAAAFEPERLMWSVADLLAQHLDQLEFAPIRNYLVNDATGVRRVQLAERVARTLDQYVVYRPLMVLAWERGVDTHWQAILWRALVDRHGSRHMAARVQQFFEKLKRHDENLDTFPGRVSIFGVSTLAPMYFEMLAALSKHVELHMFVLSPSAEYWADIRSKREVLRALARREATASDIDQALHFEEGNPLLASLGRLGRDFQQVLESSTDYEEPAANLYADPGPATMLTAVQSDILALRHRRPGNLNDPPIAIDRNDQSILVHACHGPMREVEVLYDQLVGLFDADATLQPREVMVMSPSIDAYAPFVDAVFGGDQRPGIPYSIADRAVRATDDVVNAFLTLIATLRGRLSANAVLDLLGIEPIRARFQIVAEDLPLLRKWIRDSGIRWGIDATHRQETGQPPLTQNTWRFGLDRLLLGHAMPGDGRRLYADVLPFDDVEGTDVQVLGRLVEFCEALFDAHRSLQAPRDLDAWRDHLGCFLRTMVDSTDATAAQHQQIHAALAELAEQARAGQFREPVDLETVRMQLGVSLEGGAPGRGFLTGGVTFCALVPMRSIPFRVVCLLGMNDDDFPRVRRPLGFDLMAQLPRPGDRSSRADDRQLFLEALLSARERLIITYVGQNVRDNSEIPPSVVVSELLDALDESFVVDDSDARLPPAEPARTRVVVRHPLQPFSPRYFRADRDPRLFSYARHYYEGARALRGERGHVPPFAAEPLPLGPAAKRDVSIDELARFFENPCRGFLLNRLGLYLGDDIETIDDREPLELNHLERWKVGVGVLGRLLDGEAFVDALPSVRASGALPPGALGRCLFEEVGEDAEGLAWATRELLRGNALEPLVVDSDLDGVRITGAVAKLWRGGHVRWQFSKLGGRHELAVWVRHLVLNWLRPSGYPAVSYLVGRPEKKDGATTVKFRPVDDPVGTLTKLLRIYLLGQLAPLPLFDKASRVYAEHLRGRPGEEGKALKKAEQAFRGGDFARGDATDQYVRQVFGAPDPLDPGFGVGGIAAHGTAGAPGFAELALEVFGPMLAHREEVA